MERRGGGPESQVTVEMNSDDTNASISDFNWHTPGFRSVQIQKKRKKWIKLTLKCWKSDRPKVSTSSESVLLALLFICLLFAFLSVALVLLPSSAVSENVFCFLLFAHRNEQYISIRSIRGYEDCILCIFQGFTNWFLSFFVLFFFCLPLGSVLVCRRTQTDSEQTDFAFDGEMTATEVCTSRRRCLYLYPWKNKTDIAEKWSDDEP